MGRMFCQEPRAPRSRSIQTPLLACAMMAWWLGTPPVFGEDARPNVLILTVDTLRPDALGWVAGGKNTPSLDALAAGGFRFPAAVSPAPVTLPAHASMMTGLLPRHHGARANGQVLGEIPTLAERLSALGYRTAAFVSGFPLAAHHGLDRGFSHYDDELGTERLPERRADQTTRAALDWVLGAAEPWLLWVHYYDPHDPYEPPADLRREGERGAYDGEVALVDREIGNLLRGIDEGSEAPRLTVFTSDHGESLGEHGETTHGFFIYESTLAVPLVFRWDGKISPGESRLPARLVDLSPTVLDLLGLDPLPSVDGISLLPVLRGEAEEIPPAYLESRRPWLSYGWAPLRAVRRGPWKLIAAPRPELYHLEEDPGERRNRVHGDRRVARELAGVLREIEARPATVAGSVTDPEALAKLRALGYVDAGASDPEVPEGAADPKDRVPLWNLLGEAEAALDVGDVRTAVERFNAVLVHDPDNPFALARSGAALLQAGEIAPAVARLQRAVVLQPAHPDSREDLANALTAARRLEEAIPHWMELTRLQPRRADAWSRLASSLGMVGKKAEAVEAFREAVSLAPEDPSLHVRLGFALVGVGAQAEAANRLLRAAELSGESFAHPGALGILLLRTGREPEARSWLQMSTSREGDFGEAKFQLARIEAREGRAERARQALELALTANLAYRQRASDDPLLAPLLP